MRSRSVILLLSAALAAPSAFALPPPEECGFPNVLTDAAACAGGLAPLPPIPCEEAVTTLDVEMCASELGVPALPPECAALPTDLLLCLNALGPSAPEDCDEGQQPSATDLCIPAASAPADLVNDLPDPLPLPNVFEIDLPEGTAPVLRFNAPQTGAFIGSPYVINFSTNIPMPANGPGFHAAWINASESTWQPLGNTTCASDATTVRNCTIVWTHAFNSVGSLRVGIGDQRACISAQCAVVNGVTFDTTRPVTVKDPSWIVPGQTPRGTTDVHFVTEPGANVTIWYTVNGSSTRVSAGNVTAAPDGNASFAFAPAGEWGTYRLYPRAVDRAGNVELKPTVADATLYVVDALEITVPSTSRFFKNGDTPVIDICVRHGADGVSDAGSVVTATLGGDPLPLTFVSGCTWTSGALADVSGITDLTKSALVVDATLNTLVGAYTGDVTYTPERLVAVNVYQPSLDAWVPVDYQALVEVVATYNDTGEGAYFVNVVATTDGASFYQNTTGDGFASFWLDGGTVREATYEFTVDYDYLSGAPVAVTALGTSQTVVWTQLEVALDSVQHVSNNTNVGSAFVVSYNLAWAHAPVPAQGATVELWQGTETFFSGPAGPDGVALIELTNATIATKHFAVNATYDVTPSVFAQETGLALDLNFTRIFVGLTSNTTLADIGHTFDFRVNATFLHDNASIPGAEFVLLANDSVIRELDNVTLGADGVGFGHHTFTATFDTNVSARLIGSIDGVTAQVRPFANITRIVTTEVVLGEILVSDQYVHPNELVWFNFTGTYAHNASPITRGNFTLTPDEGGAAVLCPYTSAIVSCVVTRADIYSGTFTVNVTTDDAVPLHSIRNGDPTTPGANWTKVTLSLGTPSDTLVDIGRSITVPVTARLAHTGTPVLAGALLNATNATGALLGVCTTDANGACLLSLASSAVYSDVVTLKVDASPLGVTQLETSVATGTLTWTKLIVSYTNATGPFNRSKPAGFQVNVTFAHNNASAAGVLVSVSGFSSGAQATYTDQNGYAYLPGIESVVGTRTLSMSARLPTEDLNAYTNAPGISLTMSQRWTAIGFRPYTYDPAPVEFNGDDEPIWNTGTAVTVCTVVVEADTDVPLVGATVAMRGVTRTSDANGNACLTIAASTQERIVTVTAHGSTATIAGKTITASVDQRVPMHFEAL